MLGLDWRRARVVIALDDFARIEVAPASITTIVLREHRYDVIGPNEAVAA